MLSILSVPPHISRVSARHSAKLEQPNNKNSNTKTINILSVVVELDRSETIPESMINTWQVLSPCNFHDNHLNES